MQIGGLQKVTLIDYPGLLAATVFLISCNFRCPWCYNPELVLPEKIKKQLRISEKYFFDFLRKKKKFLEGAVLCGGEPTINKDLPRFCRKIKKMGYLVKLDTNGSNPEMLKKLIREKLIDYVAMDIKAPLKNQKYNGVTGVEVNLNKIKKSIGLIKDSGIDCEFRTTIVPGIHTKEDIIQIVREISPAKKYFLQNFRPGKTLEPSFEKEKAYSSEELTEICRTISPYFDYCGIRE